MSSDPKTTKTTTTDEVIIPTPPDDSTLAASVTVIILTLVVALVFAVIRLPFIGSDAHFKTIGQKRPVVHAFLNSLSVQMFMGSNVNIPISLSMQIVYIVQTVVAFVIASALFMALASHMDVLLRSAAK